jgi:hypothetical protein
VKDPAEIVRAILHNEGVGQWLGSADNPAQPWKITVGIALPDNPDRLIKIVQAGGRSPFPQWLINFPTVQVMVRGNQNGYAEARAKITEVVDELLGIQSGLVVDGETLQSCTQMGDILPLGEDDRKRPLLSANFSLIVLPAASARTHRAPIT